MDGVSSNLKFFFFIVLCFSLTFNNGYILSKVKFFSCKQTKMTGSRAEDGVRSWLLPLSWIEKKHNSFDLPVLEMSSASCAMKNWKVRAMRQLLLSRFSPYPTLQPRRRQPTRLPRPWDSPGKNTGVGCHFLLQLDQANCSPPVSPFSFV